MSRSLFSYFPNLVFFYVETFMAYIVQFVLSTPLALLLLRVLPVIRKIPEKEHILKGTFQPNFYPLEARIAKLISHVSLTKI
jgi:hypothetical protein